MDLHLVSLKGSAVSNSMFWGICGIGEALGDLSANGQVCVSFLLMVWCEVSETGAFSLCVELGLTVIMKAFGRVLIN